MTGYGRSVDREQLRQYTCDQVAHWLCDVGFRDTSKFLSRNVDGKKLMDLKERDLFNLFPPNAVSQKSEFWNLLEAIRNDSQIPGNRQNSSMFSQRDERPPYNRPRQASVPNQGHGNFPSRFKQGDRPPMQQPIEHYTIDDSFSDEEEGNYMDDPDTLPSQTSTGHNQQYPRSGGYSDHRPFKLPPTFDRPNHNDRFNPPQTDPRSRQQGPNYTKWNPAGKVNRQPPALPGNPPISSSRLPPRPPPDEPQVPNSFGSAPPFRGPASRPQLPPPQPPPPSLPPSRDPPHPHAMSPPGVPPRSPVRHPQKLPDQFPERPPPQPPRPSQPLPGLPSQSAPIFPPNLPYHPKSRNNSDKSSPHISPRPSFKDDEDPTPRKTRIDNRSFDSPTRISPSSSRKEENNNVISHLITRQANRSTDSSSSTSSEELTHRPSVAGTFVPTKSGRHVTQFGSKMPDRPISMTQMPPLVSPAAADDVESQHWYKQNMERNEAQSYIEKENGRFVVRKRHNSNTQPYALTLWANGKFYNFVIRKRSDGEYALGSEKEGERSFASVVKLIEYHQKNPVVLAEGVGSVKLIP